MGDNSRNNAPLNLTRQLKVKLIVKMSHIPYFRNIPLKPANTHPSSTEPTWHMAGTWC